MRQSQFHLDSEILSFTFHSELEFVVEEKKSKNMEEKKLLELGKKEEKKKMTQEIESLVFSVLSLFLKGTCFYCVLLAPAFRLNAGMVLFGIIAKLDHGCVQMTL